MPADRTPVTAQGAPRPGGPYSHGIRTAGPLLFLAGQVPIDPATNQQVGGPIEQQATLARPAVAGRAYVAGVGDTVLDLKQTQSLLAESMPLM